jgi:hypothetical protein
LQPHHRATHEPDAADHAGQGQIGQQPRFHQRRLSRAARAEDQDECDPALRLARQKFAQLVARASAPEKYRRVLEFIRQQRAERRLVPADRYSGSGRSGATLQQRVQVVIELFFKFGRGHEIVRGRRVAGSAFGAEPSPNEILHERTLRPALFEYGFVVKIGSDRRCLAIQQ